MAIKQFKCDDLKPGDILVKFSDQSWLNWIIENMQYFLGGKNSQVTHAGIIYDQKHLIEVQAEGVVADDLTKENTPYGYIVFRCKNKKLADGAAQFAKILVDVSAKKKNMKYAMLDAVYALHPGKEDAEDKKALEETVEAILTDQGHDFFCSHLVVFIYQFVAEQNGMKGSDVFKLKASLVSPSTLAAHLVDSKVFDEVGYLMPHER